MKKPVPPRRFRPFGPSRSPPALEASSASPSSASGGFALDRKRLPARFAMPAQAGIPWIPGLRGRDESASKNGDVFFWTRYITFDIIPFVNPRKIGSSLRRAGRTKIAEERSALRGIRSRRLLFLPVRPGYGKSARKIHRKFFLRRNVPKMTHRSPKPQGGRLPRRWPWTGIVNPVNGERWSPCETS